MAVAMTFEVHPLAHLLPEMRDEEYAELRDDIAANGLQQPITLYEDKILDGRHRYRACTELGAYLLFTRYEGDAPAAYVLSLNVKRRQLSQSQKAMLATDFLPHLREETQKAQLRGLRRGTESPLASRDANGANPGRSAQQAAEQVGVGHAQVVRANTVKREDPELAERVRNGEVTVGAAYREVKDREQAPARRIAPASLNTGRGRQQAAAHARRLTDLANSLAGYADGVSSLDISLIKAGMEPAELAEWTRSLGDSLNKLRRFRNDLQEGRN